MGAMAFVLSFRSAPVLIARHPKAYAGLARV